MNIITTKGYIIHQRPYKETSLLISLLTDNFKFNAVLKAARSKKSLVDMFRPLEFSYKNANKDLFTIYNYQLASGGFILEGLASICGLYINELIYKLLGNNELDHIFNSYETCLDLLSKSQREFKDDKAAASIKIQKALRFFEWDLLEELGVHYSLDADCVNGEPIVESRLYYFIPDQGFSVADLAQNPSAIKPSLKGTSIINFHNKIIDAADLFFWKKFFRYQINSLLNGKTLESYKLLK